MLMALLVPHQSGALPEPGGGVRLQQTAPASRRGSPRSLYNPAVGNNPSRRDSQVLQRVQARERLLGHRADLVPLQEPGKKPQDKLVRSSPGGRDVTPRRWGTHSLLSFSRAEKGPFMSSMAQEISFFWRSLQTETKRPRC